MFTLFACLPSLLSQTSETSTIEIEDQNRTIGVVMSEEDGQNNNGRSNTLQPVYLSEDIPRMNTTTNNASGGGFSEPVFECPIVYYQAPMNHHSSNRSNLGVRQFQWTNGYPVEMHLQSNQQQQQQREIPCLRMPPYMQTTTMHTNTFQQPTAQAMINPTIASTPMSASTKRGRNDTSGNSDSNVQLRPPHAQPARGVISNNAGYKRQRRVIQQANETGYRNNNDEHVYADRRGQNQLNARRGEDSGQFAQQPSEAARRFAASRFPFSPFSVIFAKEVRDKLVVDSLIAHARDNHNFELKTVAYRRGRSEASEFRTLIFVENSESFAFLYDENNWPAELAGCKYSTRKPSIPAQLALVLTSVSNYIEWEEFVSEVKSKYPSVANVIRFKNKMQQPLRSVKLELTSHSERKEILDNGEISVMHMKFKAVEYLAQANVLICSNCFGIGHFRKNCAQKEEATCKTCGERCVNLKEHQCSGVLKCIHCAGSHSSNDAKCLVVKDYRAALTRNLLMNAPPAASHNINMHNDHNAGVPTMFDPHRVPYNVVAGGDPSYANENISQKLDTLLSKFEEEFMSTRRALAEIKEEMGVRHTVMKQQVENLETRIETVETRLDDFSLKAFTLLQNICMSLLDPKGAQSGTWKEHWQQQIKMMVDYKAMLTMTKARR